MNTLFGKILGIVSMFNFIGKAMCSVELKEYTECNNTSGTCINKKTAFGTT